MKFLLVLLGVGAAVLLLLCANQWKRKQQPQTAIVPAISLRPEPTPPRNSFDELKAKAELGDTQAQSQIGLAYLKGETGQRKMKRKLLVGSARPLPNAFLMRNNCLETATHVAKGSKRTKWKLRVGMNS